MNNATDADSERIIDTFELYEEWKSKKCLSIDGMFFFSLSFIYSFFTNMYWLKGLCHELRGCHE